MRPIDADSLKKALKDIECVGGHKYWRAGAQAMIDKMFPQIIDSEPTIKAEQVKHGQWIENKPSRMKWIPDESDGITAEETTIEDMTEQKCSICQRWAIKFTHHIEMNYCSNCGARMDGD